MFRTNKVSVEHEPEKPRKKREKRGRPIIWLTPANEQHIGLTQSATMQQ